MARSARPIPNEDRSPRNPSDVNALLGKGSDFEGKLSFEGTVHINGTFSGEIHSKDTLVIGEGAKVEGSIFVGTLIVNGDLEGTVVAKQLVEMHAPARVKGTISTPVLMIARGVLFDGQTKMQTMEQSPGPKAVPAPQDK